MNGMPALPKPLPVQIKTLVAGEDPAARIQARLISKLHSNATRLSFRLQSSPGPALDARDPPG